MTIRDMVARHSNYTHTKDFIPTPPFATRALFEYVQPSMKENTGIQGIWDPACGKGHMCEVFKEYEYGGVYASDIEDYGYPMTKTGDFKDIEMDDGNEMDVIVTNPPYAMMADFIRHGLDRATKHFALLTRIQVLEGQARYNDFYSVVPPTKVAVFSDRIPFKTGVVVRKAPKMFTHCWVYWDMAKVKAGKNNSTELMWLPPDAQKKLEKEGDYDNNDDK